ncbi:MAG: hypothetical protein HY744_34595 [Deltaproteobacteria bacterium]|nr:hypothetical protein [Deltaproteobacteria bacterium]
MSAPSSLVRATPQGQLPGIYVVGFHGDVDPSSTPARRGPVLQDGDGHLVGLDRPDGTGLLAVEISPVPVLDGGLPGLATPLPHWPAFRDDVVVALGPMERGHVSELRRGRLDEPGRRFLARLDQDAPEQDDELRCLRRDDLDIWCCSRSQADQLWRVIRDEAWRAVRCAAAERADARLVEASWWLFNAALDRDDVVRAAAGLRVGQSAEGAALVRDELRDGSGELDVTHAAERLMDLPPRYGVLSDNRDALRRQHMSRIGPAWAA